jgi:hypothetical protein
MSLEVLIQFKDILNSRSAAYQVPIHSRNWSLDWTSYRLFV